jgi:hypothetical protein
MAVRAADAWNIARFCALVAKEADDDIMCRSLVSIRDVWIDIANECELLAGRFERRPARGGPKRSRVQAAKSDRAGLPCCRTLITVRKAQ